MGDGKTTTVGGCVVDDGCIVEDGCTVGDGCTEVGATVTGDCNGGIRPPQPALASVSMNASDAMPLFV